MYESAHDHLRQLFLEGFCAGDVAEPLVSFDASTAAETARAVMNARKFEVVGVRREGIVAGYVRFEDLAAGLCGDAMTPFDEATVLPDSAGLPTVVEALSQSPRAFVTVFGRIGGIVTRSDLQKPPVRMWLFGMVAIIEMGFTRVIQEHYPDDRWTEKVSEARVEKAGMLLAERRRRNQDLDLLDCLQFSDKGQIVLRNAELRERLGFVSRRRGEETVKSLEALRNNLAHSQDIIACDWDTIVGLSENLDRVMNIHRA
jgi:hypothetical protein